MQLYGTGLVQDLTRSILSSGAPHEKNIAARDHIFSATEEEFVRVRETIHALLKPLEAEPPAPGRRTYRLFLMGHPLGAEEPENKENPS